MVPTVTVLLGADIATALTGVFFVETVFAIPGIGYTGLSAIENLDYPVITAVIIVAAVIAVIANTIVDMRMPSRSADPPCPRHRTDRPKTEARPAAA